MKTTQREAFTLIELLVVIFLILLFYTVVFSYLEKNEQRPKPLSPLTLKSTLSDAGMLTDRTTLLCINKCKSCYLRHGLNDDFEAYEEELNLQNAELYKLDSYNTLTQVEYGRYQDEPVCLILDFYPNGSSSKAVLRTSEGIFYLPSYFGEPQEVESLEDAEALWIAETKTVSDSGDFY